jgi:ribosomal protein L37AE/L43A
MNNEKLDSIRQDVENSARAEATCAYCRKPAAADDRTIHSLPACESCYDAATETIPEFETGDRVRVRDEEPERIFVVERFEFR